jgi:hypothetical protein
MTAWLPAQGKNNNPFSSISTSPTGVLENAPKCYLLLAKNILMTTMSGFKKSNIYKILV